MIGRKEEIALLDEALASDKAELIAVFCRSI